MASVWEQRFAHLVASVLSLRESVALEAIADLMPVLPVLDPADPEVRSLRGARRYGVQMNAAAVAAQYGFAYLNNPVGSNTLIVVERLFASASAAQRVQVGVTLADTLGTVFTPTAMDTRHYMFPATGIARGNYTSAAVSGELAFAELSAIGAMDLAVVLSPGFKMWIQGMTVNTSLNTTFSWRERSLSDAVELHSA